MKKIYLLTSDGHRDSLSLDYYAEDEEGIKRLVATEMKESFGKDVREIVVDFDKKKICLESRSQWESDPDDWDRETYHFLCIEKVEKN
ncbi:unnamed protein product [marine sediment metagenome]|uniref:Uncharacterized protein n=1 Tax=marine sediment metagenome TaxID=412755 RepID=X1FZP9_9ZZZZ